VGSRGLLSSTKYLFCTTIIKDRRKHRRGLSGTKKRKGRKSFGFLESVGKKPNKKPGKTKGGGGTIKTYKKSLQQGSLKQMGNGIEVTPFDCNWLLN